MNEHWMLELWTGEPMGWQPSSVPPLPKTKPLATYLAWWRTSSICQGAGDPYRLRNVKTGAIVMLG